MIIMHNKNSFFHRGIDYYCFSLFVLVQKSHLLEKIMPDGHVHFTITPFFFLFFFFVIDCLIILLPSTSAYFYEFLLAFS